jgi:hypothetical protein
VAKRSVVLLLQKLPSSVKNGLADRTCRSEYCRTCIQGPIADVISLHLPIQIPDAQAVFCLNKAVRKTPRFEIRKIVTVAEAYPDGLAPCQVYHKRDDLFHQGMEIVIRVEQAKEFYQRLVFRLRPLFIRGVASHRQGAEIIPFLIGYREQIERCTQTPSIPVKKHKFVQPVNSLSQVRDYSAGFLAERSSTYERRGRPLISSGAYPSMPAMRELQ